MTDNSRTVAGDGRGMVDDIRKHAIDAYDSARENSADAARSTGAAIGQAPLVALGAGLAAGAILAALIPTTRRERKLLTPYADRLSGAARDATDAARKAGSKKLRELGLTPDAVAEKASEAARHTAQAALGTLRKD